jgi:hypothetical protein
MSAFRALSALCPPTALRIPLTHLVASPAIGESVAKRPDSSASSSHSSASSASSIFTTAPSIFTNSVLSAAPAKSASVADGFGTSLNAAPAIHTSAKSGGDVSGAGIVDAPGVGAHGTPGAGTAVPPGKIMYVTEGVATESTIDLSDWPIGCCGFYVQDPRTGQLLAFMQNFSTNEQEMYSAVCAEYRAEHKEAPENWSIFNYAFKTGKTDAQWTEFLAWMRSRGRFKSVTPHSELERVIHRAAFVSRQVMVVVMHALISQGKYHLLAVVESSEPSLEDFAK